MRLKQLSNLSRLGAALAVFAIAAWVHGQSATSCSITGTITDATGALVPAVQVTITNQATGLSQTETSNSNGFYDAESLAPGDYSVATAKVGFKSEQIKDIHLDPGQRRGLNVKLEVGSQTISVAVEADAEVVQTESSESGGTITAAEVQNIMLNGRNFSALLTVIPGVSDVNGANNYYEAGQGANTSIAVVNGSSAEETMYTIDGVYNVTSASFITMPITPVIDHIEEMRVLSDNYSAKYGLAGRQVLITTKSGGEQFHGSGYGFARSNEYGTAHNFLQTGSVPLTSLHVSDWGITLGGPVAIPKLFTNLNKKLFFFVGADWKAVHNSYISGARNVFTSAMRGGDLSSYPALATGANMNPYLSLDAAHQAILDTRMGGGAGSGAACIYEKTGSLPYNEILPKCMDTNTVALMNTFWPLPNYNLTATATSQNYLNDNPQKFSVNDELYRGDYNVNDKNIITFRVMKEEAAAINATRGYNDYAPNPNSATDTPSMNALLRWQSTIKPTLINVASFGLIYTKYFNQLLGNYTVPSGVSINQVFPNADPLDRMPDISMDSSPGDPDAWFWMGGGALPTHSNDATQELSDDVTWVKGNHVFQGGFTYMWNLLHADAASAFPMGNFCFDGSYTNSTPGDYLLGFLSKGANGCGYGYEQTSSQRDGRFRNHWAEIYFEDDWKFSPRLTINLGLRWSYFSAPTMDGNDISNFVPSAFSASATPALCASPSGAALGTLPACAVSTYGIQSTTWQYLNTSNQPLETNDITPANLNNNGMLTAGNGTPDGFTVPQKGLFAPRIGFAYRLTNDGKTSIHGGAGFGYTQVSLLQTSNLLGNIPFVQQPVYFDTEFTNPAGGSGSVPNPPGLLSVLATSPGYRPATIRNYSLTVERQVAPGGVVSVGYAGMTTQHIFNGSSSGGWDQNFPLNANPNTGTYASTTLTASCVAASTAPNQLASGFSYDPCINQGKVNSAYYRPYQGYNTMTTGSALGVANYNGLLLGYVQKMRDLTAHVSYTFSKSLGDINASGTQVAYSSSGTFQNSRNPLGDYGKPDYDRPDVFVYSLVYNVPFFNSSSNYVERALLGGWNFTSYGLIESGFAQTPSYSSGLATRPSVSGPLSRTHGSSGKASEGQLPVYSATNFFAPSWGYFGSAQVGSMRDPKEVAFHISTEKSFAIREWAAVKIGAQAFNIFNHPNVMTLNTTWAPGSSTFGAATAFGDPREMQFYTKITF